MTARELFGLYHPRLSRLGAWPEKIDSLSCEVVSHVPDFSCIKKAEPTEMSFKDDRGFLIPVEFAAAVLRVAAEDVLERCGVVLFCTGPRGVPDYGEWGSIWIDTFRPDSPHRAHTGIRIGPFVGQTKDHALCAALDAVIGEKG